MIKNFFRIALRYLWRKKTYSVLNYICLTFGLTCAIITMLYIRNVYSYDKFHKNYNRLYSVEAYVTYFNGARLPKEYLSASLRDVLEVNAPEIEEITRVAERNFSFINGENTLNEKGIFADSNFFKVFSFPVIHAGNLNVLADMNSVVISERMAVKFFKNTDCVDRTLILKDGSKQEVFTVSGIFKDVPSQSKLQFDFVIPFSKFLSDNAWALESGTASNGTWVLLRNDINYRLVEDKIRNLIKTQETTLNQELFLFPLKEQILYRYDGGERVWKEMQNIVIIGTTGFAILLIACFNFVNIAIALNLRRHREAGIKKVAGSSQSAITLQYLGETLILTLISLISALILVRVLLAGFNSMFNYNIQLQLLNIKILAFLTAVTLFTGLISGIFPALYLASANPIDTLKGKMITDHSYSIFRQSLIVFQFVIPVVLIICMMVIKTQDSYMRNYDAGVDKDLIIINNSQNIQQHAESFRTELLTISGIDAVSFTNCIPTRGARVSNEVTWEGKDVTEKLHFWCINTDYEYNKAVKVKMVDGRFFNPAFSTDSVNYVINDVAAGVMKNKNPVGSSITVEGRKGTVIGVFKDFHALDLAGPIVPSVISINSNDRPSILVKYPAGNFPAISSQIRTIYEHYEKEELFQATLFRDLEPYSNLSLPSRLTGLAFVISILLACLGLFGLASFTAENRTKEIGIRKANGATTFSVMGLLLKSYTKWLAIAFVTGLPLAFLLGKLFLGRFHFHTPMPIWAFLAGPAIAALVALLTVSSQTWNVASQNPVKALKYE